MRVKYVNWKTKAFPSIIEDIIIKEAYLCNLLYLQIRGTERSILEERGGAGGRRGRGGKGGGAAATCWNSTELSEESLAFVILFSVLFYMFEIFHNLKAQNSQMKDWSWWLKALSFLWVTQKLLAVTDGASVSLVPSGTRWLCFMSLNPRTEELIQDSHRGYF